jgi:nucleoside phosphorylase
MVEPPIDFAIIAALKVEREAMVRRLDGMQKVQEDGEPLTYYPGTLAVPGEERPFAVVVTQLIEMGNPDAAITTTRVIQRWQPRNVLMVGIAGGVKGKASLGDVAVSQYAHYPQGKLLAELARRADARLVFGGLAAIPPVMLAGHAFLQTVPLGWPGGPQILEFC